MKYPREQQSFDTNPQTSKTTLVYDQTVTVWHAEEMLVDGTWQRFFGVVESHGVARVPAAEIEFTATETWTWGWLSNGFDSQRMGD
jgi:hypothetical protein